MWGQESRQNANDHHDNEELNRSKGTPLTAEQEGHPWMWQTKSHADLQRLKKIAERFFREGMVASQGRKNHEEIMRKSRGNPEAEASQDTREISSDCSL
jgi:hypothetical protein